MPIDIKKYVASSEKIPTDDIPWREAALKGLTDDEVFALRYFSDIESQTLRYLRVLLGMRIALRQDVAAFLSIWNYEEFYHGYYLAKLLEACGHATDQNRLAEVKSKAKLNEILEAVFVPMLSSLFYKDFPAVYLSFGAVQEMTTLLGYEALEKKTQNPALKILCNRIARQERRHFSWYFNRAKEELENSRLAQHLTYQLLKFNWVPVGAGVKSKEDVTRLFGFLFPGAEGYESASKIDQKIRSLPGLSQISLMTAYFKKNIQCSENTHLQGDNAMAF